MKVQKLSIAIVLFFLSNTAFAANDASEKNDTESVKAEKTEKVAGAAIDKFDETVEFWVEPVPTAICLKEKAGLEA